MGWGSKERCRALLVHHQEERDLELECPQMAVAGWRADRMRMRVEGHAAHYVAPHTASRFHPLPSSLLTLRV